MAKMTDSVKAYSEVESFQSTTRATFKVMVGSVFGLMAGLASQVVVAAIFGAGQAMDAFLTASVLPTYITAILISAISFSLIPVFIREQVASREEDGWALVGTTLLIVSSILLILTIVGAVSAHQIIAYSAPELSSTKASLAASMLQVMSVTLPLTALYSLSTAVQNSRGSFFWPATAPAFGSLANLVTVVGLYEHLGPMALAYGALAATAIQAAVTAVPVLRHHWKYLLPLRDARIIELGNLALPFLLFGILSRATPVLERYFASGLPDGQLSFLGYAAKIGSMVQSLLTVGVASAIYPTMARKYEEAGDQGLVQVVLYGLKLTFAIGIPVWILLSVAATPVIGVLYERYTFVHEVTLQVSRILSFSIAVIILQLFLNVIDRVFYARRNPWIVQIVWATGILVYVATAKLTVNGTGFVGLAFAQVAQNGWTFLVMVLLLSRKLAIPFDKELFHQFGEIAICAAVAGFISYLSILVVGTEMAPFTQAAIALSVGFSSYFIALTYLDRITARVLAEVLGFYIVWNLLSPVLKRLNSSFALLPGK